MGLDLTFISLKNPKHAPANIRIGEVLLNVIVICLVKGQVGNKRQFSG